LQCSNEVDYDDVVQFSKEMGSILSGNSFVFEQNLRAEQFLKTLKSQPEYLYGSNNFQTVNIVFIANQSEYLNIVLEEDFLDRLVELNNNRSFLVFVMPDNFNPFIMGSPSFLGEEEDLIEDLNYLHESFIFVRSDIYVPRKVNVDLRDTVPMEMGPGFYSFAFKGMEQTKRWELVRVLGLSNKEIKSLILEGVLEKAEVSRIDKNEGFLLEDMVSHDYSFISKILINPIRAVYTGFINMNKRIYAYSMTIF